MKINELNASRSPETGEYIPTPEEMGYTFEETLKFSPEQWDELVKKFNQERVNKRLARKVSKAENESILEHTHWYNTVPHRMIEEAVIKAIKHYPKIADDFTANISSPQLKKYYQIYVNARVKEHNLSLVKVPYKKLKKFPHFQHGENYLYGTKYQMMTMFTTLFPVIAKGKTVVTYI